MQYIRNMFFVLCVAVTAIFTLPAFADNEQLKGDIIKSMRKMHVPFIANHGQVDERVAFYADTFGGTVYVTKKGEIVYALPKYEKEVSDSEAKKAAPHERHEREMAQREKSRSVKGVVLREEVAEGFEPDVAGGEKAETIVNYFKGNDPEQWHTNIPTYKSISLGEIYPGIKLELKAYGNNVEKIFRVEPGIDPSVIQLKISGATGLRVDNGGELAMETELDPASFTAPVAYQYIEGKKAEVLAAYTIKKPAPLKGENNLVYGFEIGNYDTTKELIIDPLLASTYLGGFDYDKGYAIALDSSNNVFVTGYTMSSDYPVTGGAYDTSYNVYYDVFISRLDSSLSSLQYSTYLGGSTDEWGYAIALDSSNNVYVTGYTKSSDYPVTGGAYDTSYNGSDDVFISRLDSSLSSLQYSTYLGGSTGESGYAIALDSSNNVYVTGYTKSSDYPVTGGAYDTSYDGYGDVFISRLDSSLSSLQYSTYLGGYNDDIGRAIALDSSNNVYVTGETGSSNYPVTGGAYGTSMNSYYYYDVFISRLDGSLSSLQYSTFLGGYDDDIGRAIALDSSNNVYVTGETYSSDYPVTGGAYDTSYNGGEYDVFISRLDSSLSSLQYSIYLGGYDDDIGRAIALDSSNNVYVTGNTESSDYPVTSGAYGTSFTGRYDVFVSRLDSDLSGDSSAPSGSISINSGASYTGTTSITLTLSASNSTEVTGYYLSTSSSTPSSSASGWTSITSTTSYTASVSYTLSSGDGEKTVYVWYKDSAGNVSATASDSITLDTTAPTVSITSPTSDSSYTATSSSISLSGSASDSTSGVNTVTWSNSTTGSSGTASGTTSWSVSSINLSNGNNSITVTATDNAGNTATDTITVTYTTTSTDTTAPVVTITSPTSDSTYSTTSSSITLRGTASDDSGISSVTWSNSATGKSGTASGTTSWSILNISLSSSSNIITVTATDNADNRGKDTITVQMEPEGSDLGMIYGEVYDIDGDNIENVRMTLKNIKTAEKQIIYTDVQGYFEFTDLEKSTYKLNTKKKRYKKYKKTISLNAGQEKYLKIKLHKSSKNKGNIALTGDGQ